MANKVELTAVIKAKDEASKVFNSIGKSNSALIKGLGGLATAAAGAGIAVAGASVKMAVDFEKSMSNVATLVDTSSESMEEMGEQVMDISKRVPVELADLSTALYDVRSAGISASDAMMVLEKSAMLSVTGLGTTQEAVNLATSAINSFGFEGEEAANVFDTIQLTIKSGKTTLSELAQSFGMVAGTANTAGVSFNELMAATAALTTTGLKSSVAQTQLRAAILAIQAPTGDMADLISDLGYQSGEAMLKELGLVESMKAIDSAAEGNIDILKKSYGSVEALGSAISLTGEQGEAFIKTLNGMDDGVGTLDSTMEEANETASAQFQLLKNNINIEMTKLGLEILPRIIEKMPEITEFVGVLTTAFLGLADAVLWVADEIESFLKEADVFGDVVGNIIGEATGIPALKRADTLIAENVEGYEGIIGGEGGILSRESVNNFGMKLLGGTPKEMEDIELPTSPRNPTINLDLRGATVTDEEITKRITDNIFKSVGYSQVAK